MKLLILRCQLQAEKRFRPSTGVDAMSSFSDSNVGDLLLSEICDILMLSMTVGHFASQASI